MEPYKKMTRRSVQNRLAPRVFRVDYDRSKAWSVISFGASGSLLPVRLFVMRALHQDFK
jgi:hypothetical protein